MFVFSMIVTFVHTHCLWSVDQTAIYNRLGYIKEFEEKMEVCNVHACLPIVSEV